MNQFDETAALIGNEPRLVAVVTRPAAGQFRRDDFGVILLGAGLVHHVGPNRLMTRVARMLAGLGLTCIRFDHRGIGDSAAQASAKPFEVTAVEETIEVMDWFQRTEGLDSFAVVGICSGAETAMKAALADDRVAGIVMINGGGQGAGSDWDTYEYVRGEAGHYLQRSLFNRDSWYRALTGRIQYRRLLGVLLTQIINKLVPKKAIKEAASSTAEEIESLIARGVLLLWVQSEKDFSRRYFETMFGGDAGRLASFANVRIEVIEPFFRPLHLRVPEKS